MRTVLVAIHATKMREISSPYLLPMVLGIIVGATEVVIAAFKRSGAVAARTDKGSLYVFWILIPGGIWLAVYAAIAVPAARFPLSLPVEWTAISLFAAGLALRWYSIIHLGRFFTVDVAVAPDHHVVDTGPYRYMRHPSYTGGLLVIAGIGLSMGNVLAIVALMVPVILTYAYRIRTEEAVLRAGIGEPYVAYCARTRRLIPGLF